MAYGTVNAEQMTTQSGFTLGAGNASSFKNRAINGAMVIDQRNAGAVLTISGGGTGLYTVDRLLCYSATNAVTAQRSTTAPTGFINSLLYTQSGTGAVAAGDFGLISQRIEGYNIADLGWGTATAQTVTISFWVRSSLTGTFGFTLLNSAQNRRFTTSYTISTANTFEYKTITIPGDTSGTWLTDNSTGVGLYWDMGCGTTYSSAAGSVWGTGTTYGLTGGTKVCATTGATFYITGVQLEVGTVATSFDYRPYGTELALCQRYYEVLYEPFGAGRCNASPAPRFFARFTVVKRATPTCAGTGSFSCSDMYTTDATQTANQGASIIANQTTNGCVFGFNASTLNNSTPFVTAALAYNLSNTGVITASAEL